MIYMLECKKLILLAVFFLQIFHALQISAQRLRPEDRPPTFDLSKERASELAFAAGREASGLKDLSDRIGIQLEAARILAAARPDQATQLLDAAWDAVKEVMESEKTSERERNAAARLRVNVLTLYAKLDPERAKKLEKSLSPPPGDAERESEPRKRQPEVPPGRERADYLVRIGLEQLKSSPTEGISTALSSLETGGVSFHLSAMPKAILAKAGRQAADDFEKKVAAALSNRSSLDDKDHLNAIYFLGSDGEMPPAARRGLLNFLFNSLQNLAQLVRQKPGREFSANEVDKFKSAYSIFARGIRARFAEDLPNKLSLFDAYLNEVAALIPPSWLDFHYELWTTDPAEDQLARALKTPDQKLRDTRLTNFTMRALNVKPPIKKEQRLDFAAKAVAEIKDEETKATLQDFVRMVEVMNLAEEKLLPAATDKAKSISRLDWRAWVLLGLADAQAKENRDAARALHEEAWRALEKSSVSPRKAELAFLLARMVGGYDQPRAAEIVTAAVKHTNQAAEMGSKEWTMPTQLQAFYVRLGSLHFPPGEELLGVGEIGFGDEIGRLARYDWTRAESTGQSITDMSLRLRYLLAMSKGVLTDAKGN